MIKGAKKGSQQAHKPHIAKDDLVSTETLNAMYGLCEGEIAGLADGGKSIRLDGTPIINDNGQPNFDGVTYEFRPGTNDQSYIKGFPSVENEIRVGVELRHDRQYVRAINNKELSAVRLRLNFNALRQQYDNGNITGYAIEYAVDVQTDGGAFVQVLSTAVRGKASSGFKRSHRIDLPKASRNWTIRVRRITPNRDSDLIADTMTVDAITEIIDAKLRYPNTAMLAVSYNAKTFSNVAKIAVRLKGKLIQVPSNYDPVARTYTGLWDGTFKLAYSDNPAWVFYDLCTHKRYGLGDRLSGMVDKWRLYQIAQYCDEMVDDGMGGREPRFAINVYIQKADDAYRVLQNIASVFRGLSFWDGLQIVLDSDTPKDPVYTFSAVNVVGEFNYQGTRQRDRHTVAKVAWDNPGNEYSTEYEMVRDEAAIAKYGIRMLDINAFGCTSKGQAQRAGLWALKSEQLETRTVSFKTGLMGFIPQVGQIINIADNVFAGRAVSGRIVSANARQITLDRTAGKVGDTLSINTDGTVKTAKIAAVRGDTLTLDKAIGNADDVWAIVADDLKLMQFRVLTIAQNDDATFDITALQYDRQKYDVVDNGASITQQPYTVLKATPIAAPKSVTIIANTRTHQGQAVTTLNIAWEQVQGAVAYIVEWRKDDGNWQTLPRVSGQSVDIDGVYSGNYLARVRAVDSFDSESLATSSVLTRVAGKAGKPAKLDGLTVMGGLFSMALGWTFGAKSEDTNFTEIQVSPDGSSNISTLGTFAYPTNKHEITGLQGNLTQYYRARIVDKLGNVSDWTAWQRGTTSADASKVLDILSGQISASHLDQTLRTPIGKIGTLESAVNAVNSQLPSLNEQIRQARSAIDGAVRNIDELTRDKNAKTQELANLKQTVGGQTSTITELGVTTGDLSQKYLQLKTASDGYDTEIKKIQQTTKEQAIEQTRLRSSYSDNLLGLHDSVTTSNYLMATIPMRRILERGQNVVITIYADLGDDRTGLMIANSTPHAASALHRFNKVENGVYQAAVNWNDGIGSNDSVLVYQLTSSSTSSSTLHNVRITLADAMMPNILDNNLLVSSTDYNIARYKLNSSPAHGEQVVITIYGALGAGRTHFGLYNSGGDTLVGTTIKIGDGMYQWSGAWNTTTNRGGTASNDSLLVYQFASSATSSSTINRITIERTSSAVALQQISQVKATADDLSAQYTVKVQTGGIVSGIGLMSSNGVSAFAVRADQFYIAPPTGTSKGVVPFTVQTTPRTVNGVSVPAGTYIDNAFIANGAITTAKIGTAQVDTLQIAGEAITVPRMQYNAGVRRFTQAGEIELGRITINAGGGNVMLSMGFARLFTLPWGAYLSGTLQPVLASPNFRDFVNKYADDAASHSTVDVLFRIKRNGVEIHKVAFKFNYGSNFGAIAILYDQYTMPQILDTPPAGNTVYTVVMVVQSDYAHYNDADNVERQARITGFSFSALGVKR